MRIAYPELFDGLLGVLLKLGFDQERGSLCARLFTDASRDGVYSHGLNRFPQFVGMIKSGVVNVAAEPELIAGFGSLEKWDGKSGPGNLNAYRSMERAILLSHERGIGWTNTLPNLPPWGASDPRVGNNPMVIAVPRAKGHVVLDMAMSQFSYGALASYRMRGEQLPVEGGFDSAGMLTRDPAAIEISKRPLPIGYWKGSGLALMLDMVGAILSGGCATHQIPADPEKETKLSQVFIAIDPVAGQSGASVNLADQILEHLQSPQPADGEHVRYPGERVLQARKENLANGIPVEPAIWRDVHGLV